MPELPEVETVVRTLEHQIQDEQITDIKVFYDKIIVGNKRSFKKALVGQHFREFDRRGKYLLFKLDDCMLVVHLRMEGKFFIADADDPLNKHIHLYFSLSNGKQLRYQDTRKFGRMEIHPLDVDLSNFHNLGPEPFSKEFSQRYIHEYISGKRLPMKTLLLDQSFVAGVGNIYADEILFACGILPDRSCNNISIEEEKLIVKHTRRILKAAIKAGGTTIRSYTSSLGVTGRFQLQCKVHGQKVCKKCGNEILIKRIGGRSSYYCKSCQK